MSASRPKEGEAPQNEPSQQGTGNPREEHDRNKVLGSCPFYRCPSEAACRIEHKCVGAAPR